VEETPDLSQRTIGIFRISLNVKCDGFVKSQKLKKCHAEPCAELDSVLIQHLKKSRAEPLEQVQGDKSGLFTRSSNVKAQSSNEIQSQSDKKEVFDI
jgi:hypothetical protein